MAIIEWLREQISEYPLISAGISAVAGWYFGSSAKAAISSLLRYIMSWFGV